MIRTAGTPFGRVVRMDWSLFDYVGVILLCRFGRWRGRRWIAIEVGGVQVEVWSSILVTTFSPRPSARSLRLRARARSWGRNSFRLHRYCVICFLAHSLCWRPIYESLLGTPSRLGPDIPSILRSSLGGREWEEVGGRDGAGLCSLSCQVRHEPGQKRILHGTQIIWSMMSVRVDFSLGRDTVPNANKKQQIKNQPVASKHSLVRTLSMLVAAGALKSSSG